MGSGGEHASLSGGSIIPVVLDTANEESHKVYINWFFC